MTGSNCFASSKHLSNFQNQTRSSHAQENWLVSRSHRKQPKKYVKKLRFMQPVLPRENVIVWWITFPSDWSCCQVVVTLKKYNHRLPWTLDWKFRLQRIYKICENLPSHLTGSSPFVQEPSNWQRLCPGPFRWYPLGHSNEQTVSTSLGPLVQEWSVITWAPTLRAGHFFSPGAAAENKFQIFFLKFLFHYLRRLNVSLDHTQRAKAWSKTR